jgi:hypothetical protein
VLDQGVVAGLLQVAANRTDVSVVFLLRWIPVPSRRPAMKMVIRLTIVLLTVGLARLSVAAPAPPEREKPLTALEKKMVGTWKGRIGCDGRLIFHANGTYELKEYGPGSCDREGTWKVQWDALPPTLTLTCKTSKIADLVGKTMKVKLIKLDGDTLAIEYENKNGSPTGHYTRVKK